MSGSTIPFELPLRLPPDLAPVHRYWKELKRGENTMPFWDDVNLSALPDLSDNLMLLDVFLGPQRFRFNTVGDRVAEHYGALLAGRFVDEIEPKSPFQYFVAQADVAVEARAPTYFHHAPNPEVGSVKSSYSRVILPLWGDGQVRMLLGGISFEMA